MHTLACEKPPAQRASKKPKPTKFFPSDEAILVAANRATGFPITELIRRSVRLMGRQSAVTKSYDFLTGLHA